MSSRPTRDSGGGVLSFTFLDVLTCTMGSLVLLVVILGQKAGKTSLEEALRNAKAGAVSHGGEHPSATETAPGGASPQVSTPPTADPASQVGDAELATLQSQDIELQRLREKAKQRLAEEQERLAHLEEHERRLEHELAKLHVNLELLNASEQKQSVDQETADRELVRINELIADTEKNIQSLTMEGGKKSYAVVPYKGKYGTFRRPIYIECTKNWITIQPEGVRFDLAEYSQWTKTGNPLAAAIRAAHKELNARAVAAGEQDMPDPYPLFIVRPDGAHTYFQARSAVDSWDSDYGEEFVEANWTLDYPEVDGQLEQIMTHAAALARARQQRLAQIAPRQYGRSSNAPSKGTLQPVDLAALGGVGSGPGRHGDGWLAAPKDHSGESAGEGPRRRYGELAKSEGPTSGDFIDEFLPQDDAPQAAAAVGSVGGNALTGTATGPMEGVPGGPAASGAMVPTPTAMAASPGAVDANGAAMAAGGLMPGTAPLAEGSSYIQAESKAPPQEQSAAKARGSNWANVAASRGAPITRPIHVIVGVDQLTIAPTSEAGRQYGEKYVVTFRQSREDVLDELAIVLQRHIEDWGYAGKGMYWRPTLSLQVSPEAVRQAERLNDLLTDSGVDVRLEHIAALPDVESEHARK